MVSNQTGLLVTVPTATQRLITVYPDGTVTLADGLRLDEASRAFWEYIGGENARLLVAITAKDAEIARLTSLVATQKERIDWLLDTRGGAAHDRAMGGRQCHCEGAR